MTDPVNMSETQAPSDSASPAPQEQISVVENRAPSTSTSRDSSIREIYLSLREIYPVQNMAMDRMLMQAARHLDLMMQGGEAELAALALGHEAGQSLALGSDSPATPQTSLLIALGNPATSRCCQYQTFHLQQYQQLIRQVENLIRRGTSPPRDFNIRNYFPNESDCLVHLRARMLTQDWSCPRCGHPRGDWLSGSARWECRECHAQTGVRWGTLMASSKLPLTLWFHVIDLVANGRPMTGVELAREVGMERASTARKMQTAVRSALMTDDADRLLAGIHRFRFQISSLS